MKMFKYNFVISLVLALCVVFFKNSWLVYPLLWAFSAVALVSAAYLFNRPTIFRKRSTGEIPLLVKLVLLPYLLVAQSYNWIVCRQKSHVACSKLSDNVFVASRLSKSDVPMLRAEGISAILDVTAEYDGLNLSQSDEGFFYLNIPILDHHIPSPTQIAQALAWIEVMHNESRRVVVHCALGRGRSVFVCAAYFLAQSASSNTDTVMESIQQHRIKARLNKQQRRALTALHQKDLLQHKEQLGMLVNPVAGGGKWMRYENDILGYLTKRYRLVIAKTQPDKTPSESAKLLFNEHEFDVFVAGGGDGTLAAASEIAMENQCTFGILPLGTANSLAHVLQGVVTKFDPIDRACRTLLSGKLQTIDTIDCNGITMLLVAAIGIEAKMIADSDRESKNEQGQFAYIRHFMDALLDNDDITVQVTVDENKTQVVHCASLVVANAAPKVTILAQGGQTEPDYQDGQLDVTIVPHQENVQDYLSVAQVLLGEKPSKDNMVRHFCCKKLHLQFQETRNVAIDGEVHQFDEMSFEIRPKSLVMMVPKA